MVEDDQVDGQLEEQQTDQAAAYHIESKQAAHYKVPMQGPVVVVGCPSVEYHQAAASVLLDDQAVNDAGATTAHKRKNQGCVGAYFDRDIRKLDDPLMKELSLEDIFVNFTVGYPADPGHHEDVALFLFVKDVDSGQTLKIPEVVDEFAGV